MKTKAIIITLLAVAAALFAAACGQSTETPRQTTRTERPHQQTHQNTAARVPAFMDAARAKNLGPTLSPERFIGPTRDAYRVAQEIPETIAQLPCYCYCDQSVGHKSLHSCFEDMHASQCAVCVSEALQAYDLQKKGMTPTQIRELIVSQYSRQ